MTSPDPMLLLDGLTFTGRMLAKAPAEGYALWLDVLATTPDHIYICEAPSTTGETTANFRGIRLTLVGGTPLGKVAVADGFAWTDRATATWA